MRIFETSASQAHEHASLARFMHPGACDASFLWLSLTRSELQATLGQVQELLQVLCGTQLVDLHVSDLLNDQLPSHFDYTSQYDLLVVRRLARGAHGWRGSLPWLLSRRRNCLSRDLCH